MLYCRLCWRMLRQAYSIHATHMRQYPVTNAVVGMRRPLCSRAGRQRYFEPARAHHVLSTLLVTTARSIAHASIRLQDPARPALVRPQLDSPAQHARAPRVPLRSPVLLGRGRVCAGGLPGQEHARRRHLPGMCIVAVLVPGAVAVAFLNRTTAHRIPSQHDCATAPALVPCSCCAWLQRESHVPTLPVVASHLRPPTLCACLHL